jgi:hypothetical protein
MSREMLRKRAPWATESCSSARASLRDVFREKKAESSSNSLSSFWLLLSFDFETLRSKPFFIRLLEMRLVLSASLFAVSS